MEALDHPWMRLGHADIPHVTPGLAKAEVCSLERFATFENDMKRLAIRAVAFHLDAVGACRRRKMQYRSKRSAALSS